MSSVWPRAPQSPRDTYTQQLVNETLRMVPPKKKKSARRTRVTVESARSDSPKHTPQYRVRAAFVHVPRVQCKKCPWKIGTDPHDIPKGYCVQKHAGLVNTIANPGEVRISGDLHIMACHETKVGHELPCVGWLDNQLNEGNNVLLRFLVSRGKISGNYRTVGPQHKRLEDTLPPEVARPSPRLGKSPLCPFCKRPNKVSPRAYEENPFCAACFHERVKKLQDELGNPKMKIVEDGHYFVATFEEVRPSRDVPVEDTDEHR